MRVKRIGPESGYDNSPNKVRYREDVWTVFRKFFTPVVGNYDKKTQQRVDLCSQAHVALLPSIEGTEIKVALSRGFLEQNLHIIDQNAAIVATLKKRYPKINTYGVTADRAFERMAEHGIKLHAANLDFCSNLSDQLISWLQIISRSGVMVAGSPVSVTVLRGRERTGITELLYDMKKRSRGLHWMTDLDRSRVTSIVQCFNPDRHYRPPFAAHIGCYSSTSRQSMMWVVVNTSGRGYVWSDFKVPGESRRYQGGAPTGWNWTEAR